LKRVFAMFVVFSALFAVGVLAATASGADTPQSHSADFYPPSTLVPAPNFVPEIQRPSSALDVGSGSGGLPFTGADVALLAIGASGATATGFVLIRVGRRPPRGVHPQDVDPQGTAISWCNEASPSGSQETEDLVPLKWAAPAPASVRSPSLTVGRAIPDVIREVRDRSLDAAAGKPVIEASGAVAAALWSTQEELGAVVGDLRTRVIALERKVRR
jgi:hypothetical protein